MVNTKQTFSIAVFVIQVKYDLTKAVTRHDDKETIHCEFDVAGSGIEWLSGWICSRFVVFFTSSAHLSSHLD